MKNKRFQLNWISTYRTELFGIAILSVLFFHFAMMHVENIPDGQGLVYSLIRKFRYIFASSGVDIFTFLSGMGLYYSFSRNSDIAGFYSRRFKRILIPYVIVGGIFWVRVDLFYRLAGFERLLKDFFYVTFVTEGVNHLWFISFIGAMYLVFPFLYIAIFHKRSGSFWFVFLLAIAIIAPVLMLIYAPDLYKNINIAVTRVPVFIIGIASGKAIKDKKEIPHIIIIGLIAVCFLIKYYARQNHFDKYMLRYTSCIFAIGVMLLCIYILKALDSAKLIRKVLCFFGQYSLEFYLLHILMWELFAEAGIPLFMADRYAAMICVCAVLAPILNKTTNVLSRVLSRAKTVKLQVQKGQNPS